MLGKHLIAELWTPATRLLDDPALIRDAFSAAAARGGFRVIDIRVHPFAPHGVTAVCLLAESHMSIHTWPEHGYAALDVFACAGDVWAALEEMKEALQVERIEVRELDRGLPGAIESRAAGAAWDRAARL